MHPSWRLRLLISPSMHQRWVFNGHNIGHAKWLEELDFVYILDERCDTLTNELNCIIEDSYLKLSFTAANVCRFNRVFFSDPIWETAVLWPHLSTLELFRRGH
jgi:hypothetical protein